MSNQSNNKVGSSQEAAGKVVNEDDFGAHEEDVQKRNYVSQETRSEDPGHGTTRSGTGTRTAGVGGNDSGRGSSSGGDVDTGADALVGIGDKNQHPPHHNPQNTHQGRQEPLKKPVMGPSDGNTRQGSESAADVNSEVNQTGNSFKGDVTADEATGGA